MKIKLLFIIMFCSLVSWGQTVTYSSLTTITCPATPVATISPAVPGLTFTQISRGTGVTCSAAPGSISGSGFNGNLTSNITGSKWYTFDVTSDPTVGFNVSNLTIVSRVSNATGSPSVSVQGSVNGGVKFVIGTFIPTNSASSYSIPTNLTVAANSTLNIFIIPNSLNAAGTTCRVENATSITLITTPTCTPTAITSVFPLSGSQNTEVTINAASGLLGATATFNGIAATPVSSSATQLIVLVPAGATTGNLVVTNSIPCASIAIPFTIFKQDKTGCDGAATTPTDLFISEVTDSTTGGLSYVEIYNPTASPIQLSNYNLKTYGNGSTGTPVPSILPLNSFILNPGSVYVVALGISSSPDTSNTCSVANGNGEASNQSTTTGGINFDPTGTAGNANDFIGLYQGATLIDAFGVFGSLTWANGLGLGDRGATFKRKITATPLPNTSFSSGDWNITDWVGIGQASCSTNDYSDIGLFVFPAASTVPIINTQPTVSVTCASTSATLAVTATEGFVGGNTLAYNWFAVAPSTTTWIDLVATPLSGHTGANTASLVISPLLDGYQYYCQVRENTTTCYIATVSVKISISTTTWNGTAPWTNGTPTLSKAAIINGTYNTGTDGSFDACNVTVNTSKTLTISGGTYVNIQNGLVVNGTVLVQNNGSLVQINDLAVNSGNITVERTAVVDPQDYVYWSAPVSGQSLATQFSTTPASLKWRWDVTAINANGTEGNWLAHNAAMADGVGYIVGNTTNATFTKSFTGNTHNGVYTPQIKRGSVLTVRKDNWNLLGNPYPSAISVDKFLSLNTNLEGYVNIWRHGLNPTNTVSPFYQNFNLNYFSSDYLTVNNTGNINDPSDYKIASGQGFMVAMKDGPSTTTTASFNNSLRDKGYVNNVFYKTTSASSTTKNRIWLDLVSVSEYSRTMFGYLEHATNDFDDRYDAQTNIGSGLKLFTVLNNDRFGIQGKALPFTDTDLVTLGIHTPMAGNFTIAIAVVDGLFSNNAQTIYLEDKLLNVIHNLNTNPYAFSANPGTVSDRFVIRYTNTALNTNNFEAVANQVSVFGTNNGITIDSKIASIKSYVVYNVLGQVVASENNISKNVSEITSIQKNNQALVVKATLDNDQVITKKIIF